MIFWKNYDFKLNNEYVYRKKRENIVASDTIIAFDIEVTQMFKPYDEWITYDYDIEEKEYTGKPCIAFPYIWQLCIDGDVIYGRKWDDVKDVFSRLNDFNVKLICYVHNLSYEFCFLRNLFKVKEVFARKAHSIMKCIFEGIENIEFRCSYFLTRLSLFEWGKKISKESGEVIEKKVGNLDYNVFRTEHTILSKEEMEYCEADVYVMFKGILLYLKKYKHVKDIPLTQTGEVRLRVKEVSNDCGFNKKALSLQPDTYDMYLKMLAVTRGGDSHANYIYCNKIFYDMQCLDYQSSYPFQMCCKPVPMTKFKRGVYVKEKNKCYILKIALIGVKSKKSLHYIPSSKCIDLRKNKKEKNLNYSKDNGRIINADYLELWVTDLDLDIINQVYKYDKCEVLDCYSSLLGYMPANIVKLILEYFAYKTSYKGVEGFESIYLFSKQFINSIYGMSITKLVQDDIVFCNKNGTYDFGLKTLEEKEDALSKQLRWASKNPLHYGFGLWCVTNGRKMLWDGFKTLGYDNVYYYDTDSYKGYFNKSDIEKINEKNLKLMLDMQKRYGFKDDLVFPKDSEGNVQILGQLDIEKSYQEVKFLGAKKYAYKQDNEYHITVAGLPKQCGECLNSLDEFTDNWHLTPKETGKMTTIYQESQPRPSICGYQVNVSKSVVLMPVGFTNTLAEDFINLISLL